MPGYDALVEELLTECEEANKPSPQASQGENQLSYGWEASINWRKIVSASFFVDAKTYIVDLV